MTREILIIGGTGTLGQELTRQILDLNKDTSVIIFSRDELKQAQMKRHFNSDRIQFILGDVRDKESLERVYDLRGRIQAVFHVAALKHIDICEENPEECIKTNLLGTSNILDVFDGLHINFCSTDKAVDPINVYGYSKALSEKLILSRGGSVFRWGNVLMSRGSALGYFARQILDGQPVSITDTEMTRYWIKIEDAVKFMLETFEKPGVHILPNMKSASVLSIVDAIGQVLGKDYKTKIVGLRPGEKIHEAIKSQHDDYKANSFDAPRYSPEELVQVLRPGIEKVRDEYLNSRR